MTPTAYNAAYGANIVEENDPLLIKVHVYADGLLIEECSNYYEVVIERGHYIYDMDELEKAERKLYEFYKEDINYSHKYEHDLKDCPNYKGYIPKNLTHEVCKNCGNIEYFH